MKSLLIYTILFQFIAFSPLKTVEDRCSFAGLGLSTNASSSLSLKILDRARATSVVNQARASDSSLIKADNEDEFCLTGKIEWKTNAYQTEGKQPAFPLIRAKVCIYNDFGIAASTRTDASGKFKFNLKDNTTLWDSLEDYKLKIVLQSDDAVLYTRKIDGEIGSGADCFESDSNPNDPDFFMAGKGEIPISRNENSNASFSIDCCFDSDTWTGQFFQLYTMLQLYAEHAKELDKNISKDKIPACNLMYPCKVDKNILMIN